MVTLREECPEDIEAIRAVHHHAFGRPHEGRIVDALRTHRGVLLSLVATVNDRIVAHLLYSPVSIGTDPKIVMGAGLGPLAVLPAYQRQGIGAMLVSAGNQQLQARACPYIVVLGHPTYYPRFGFRPASGYGIRCAWDVPDEVFMVLMMEPATMQGVAGVAQYRQEFAEER